MIVPDINLLLYAYDTDSPFHKQAAGWWEQCLSGTEAVGLAPVVLFGFLRIATHARVFKNPLPPAEAAEHIRSWLAQPCAEMLPASHLHVPAVLESVERLGTAGNLVTMPRLRRSRSSTTQLCIQRIPTFSGLPVCTGTIRSRAQ